MQEFIAQTLRNTFFDPKRAAQDLIGLGLSRQVLWMAVVLAAIVQSLAAFALGNALLLNPDFQKELAELAKQTDQENIYSVQPPLISAITGIGGLVLMIFLLNWCGRMIGGVATLERIMVLMAWLNIVYAAVIALFVGLFLLVPFLAFVIAVFGPMWLLYTFAAFVTVAHEFPSMAKGFGTIFLMIVLFMIGISMFSGLFISMMMPFSG